MDTLKPAKGPLSKLSDDEFDEFIVKLGFLVFRMIPVAAFARHRHPTSTVVDYLDVKAPRATPQEIAKELLKDICGRNLNTEELSEKWFEETAGKLALGVSLDLEVGT